MINCPVCESDKSIPFVSLVGYTEQYQLCECGAAFLDPMPTSEYLDAWYSSGMYREKTALDDPGHVGALRQQVDRAKMIAKIVANMNVKSHLDIGCSNGDLLRAVQEYHPGIISIGIDKDPILTTTDFPVYNDIHMATGKYDLITIIQTLEHINNPRELLRLVYERLRHTGLLIVEVPNRRSNMIAYIPPQHVIAYDEFSLRRVMDNFKMLETRMHGYPDMSPLDLNILQLATK